MLQRNAYFNYPDIDPVHDKVMGRLLSADSAEKAGDLPSALESVESTFDVHGFNGTSPHFTHCVQERTRLRKLLGMMDSSPDVVRADSEDGLDVLDRTTYVDPVDAEAELVEAL